MGLIRGPDLSSVCSDLRTMEQETQVFSSAELLHHTELKKQFQPSELVIMVTNTLSCRHLKNFSLASGTTGQDDCL